MPPWLAWLAALNPLSFAIEPIRAVYNGSPNWPTVVLDAPYGSVTMGACLLVLAGLAVLLFLSIRPLLHRKLG